MAVSASRVSAITEAQMEAAEGQMSRFLLMSAEETAEAVAHAED